MRWPMFADETDLHLMSQEAGRRERVERTVLAMLKEKRKVQQQTTRIAQFVANMGGRHDRTATC